MKKKMLINVADEEESRVAIVEDGILEEFTIEVSSKELIRGNIYNGRYGQNRTEFASCLRGLRWQAARLPAHGRNPPTLVCR